MAKRKRGLSFAPFEASVQVSMLPEMIDDVVTWIATPDKVYAAFLGLVNDNYAVACKPKPEGDYQASIQVLMPDDQNAGYMIFGNGPSALEAMAVLLVKLNFIGLESDWSSKVSRGTKSQYR